MTVSENLERKLKLENQLLEQKSPYRWFPLLIVGVIVLNLFITLRSSQKIQNLAITKPFIYVQTENGEVIAAKAVNELHRNEHVIQTFAQEWLIHGFTWKLNGSNISSVREKEVEYPTPLHDASLAISPEYREGYLLALNDKYSEQFKFRDYILGQRQSYIRIFDQPVVKEVEPGIWDVTIVAYRTHTEGKSIIAEEQFNHILRVKAIEPGEEEESQKDVMHQKLKDMQRKGLQIVSITVI